MKKKKMFVLLLIGVYLFGIVGVVMGETVPAAQPPGASTGGSQGMDQIFVDKNDKSKLTDKLNGENIPVTSKEQLKEASSETLKQHWDKISPEIRRDYLKTYSDDAVNNKQLTAEQLTSEEIFKDLIQDPDNQQLWDKIKVKPDLSRDVFKKMFPEADVTKADFSKSGFGRMTLKDGSVVKSFDYFKDNPALSTKAQIPIDELKVLKTTFGENNFIKVDFTEQMGGGSMEFNNGAWSRLPPNTPGSPPQRPGGDIPPGGPAAPGDGCGGGGGGGGGGGSEPKIGDQAVQVAQQMAGLAAQLLGPLKDVLSSGKGNTKVSDSSGGDTQIALDDGAKAVVKSKEEKDKEVQLAQADTTKTAVATVDNKLNAELEGNNLMTIPNVAVVAVPDGAAKTTVINDAETAGTSKITAAVISADGDRQFVKFTKQDMEMSGERFLVLVLKDFNDVKGFGRNLNIRNGNTLIKFNDGKTLYPTEVRGVPYSMNKIQNKIDIERYFIIKEKSLGNYLVDDKKILTVGDDTVEIDGMIVAKSRKDMFKDMVVE